MKIEAERYYSPKDLIVANGGPLALSRSAVYAAIQKGSIPYRKFGKRILIPGTYVQSIIPA